MALARKARETPSGASFLYHQPTPAQVYALAVTHGHDAAMERWAMFGTRTVQGWLSAGRIHATGLAAKSRTRTPEQRREIVDAVFAHGSPSGAARALGLKLSIVLATLVTEGVTEHPKITPQDRGRRPHAAGRGKRSRPSLIS